MQELQRVAALRELHRQGTIARAASVLGFTASAVSQQLSSLEAEVGVPLINRGPRSAELNASGQAYLVQAEEAMSLLVQARARAHEVVGKLSGRVTVASIPSVARHLASAVVNLRAEEPLLDVALVQLAVARAQLGLTEGRIDIAVIDDWGTRPKVLDPRITSQVCVSEPVVLAVASEHVRTDGQDWRDALDQALDRIPLLSATDEYVSREFCDTFLAKNGITVGMRWEFDGLTTLAALVAEGRGFSFLPRNIARVHGDAVTCYQLPEEAQYSIHCLWRKDWGTAAKSIERCLDLVMSELPRQIRAQI